MNKEQKQQRYERITTQLAEVLTVTDDRVARMATIAAVLHHKMNHFFWTGFYQLIDGELIVGPYQGFLACQKLKLNTGVCWAAVNRREPVVVPDVEAFPGHIACDARSKSEITIPCFDASGGVFAVLDVDSDRLDMFDDIDAQMLTRIVTMIGSD